MEIPDRRKLKDIKRESELPVRSLIEVTRGMLRRVDDDEEIDNSRLYIDVPVYKRGLNIPRLVAELEALDELLKVIYNENIDIITNLEEPAYIAIRELPLPDAYEPNKIDILIRIPKEYPEIPPGLNTANGIYVTGGLKYKGKPLQCGRDQYHWDCGHNPSDMKKKGWAWWCFADLDAWDPTKDTLLQVFFILRETLENPDKQEFG